MLIAFGGLPGTGKTTLARIVASRYAATYLRIDTIEQAIQESDVLQVEVGAAGYLTAYRVAADNLRIGRTVVGDAVNPLNITRDSWAEVARLANVRLVEVEVICSDVQEHRRRVESRRSEIEGRPSPTWEEVIKLKTELWKRPHIVIDTARKSIIEAQDELMRKLAREPDLIALPGTAQAGRGLPWEDPEDRT